MYGYVYVTSCDLNEKLYVGHRKWNKEYSDEEYELVSQEIKDKFNKIGLRAFPIDTEYLGSGKKLKEDINKYGKSHFHCAVIDVGYSREELTSKETYWITHYANQGFDLYNIRFEGNTGFDPDIMPQDKRETYIDNLKRLAKEMDFGSRFGDVSGENNGRYGKPVSEITRLRISNANKGRIQSEEERLKRRISHMTKCPDIKPPNLKGYVSVTDGCIERKIPGQELENFLSENPGWKKGCRKRANYKKRKRV